MFDYFVFGVEFEYCYDWVEDFFVCDGYVVGDIGKDGGFDELVGIFVGCVVGDEVCVFGFVCFDIV